MRTLNLVETNATKTSLKERRLQELARAPRLRVEGDELFPELARIECRVCGQEERVSLDHPALLCTPCLSDLSTAARSVADAYARAMVAFFAVGKELAEASAGNEWYAKTEEARANMGVNSATFTLAWQRAKTGGGVKTMLCDLRDKLDEAAEAMRAAELRYIAAAPELEAARANAGEPINV